MKKVTVFTNGCPENRNDCARMEELLKLNGLKITRDFKLSDLILFNACGLTDSQEERSIKIIKHVSEHKKAEAKLIVWGCLTKINLQVLRTVYDGPIFGSDEVLKIAKVIALGKNPSDIHANYLGSQPSFNLTKNKRKYSLQTLRDPRNVLRKLLEPRYNRQADTVNLYADSSFIIKTSTGCMSKCAYCAVKISRGKVKSKPINAIAAEFKAGLQRGFTDFSLIGTDVGSYGMDQKMMLTDLLEVLTTLPGKYQIRIRNFQPRHLIKMLPQMQRILARNKISLIGISAQSGSNRILKAMQRGYVIEDYIHAVKEIKKASPELKIRNQLMVGFPGETETDFQHTLNLLDEIQFDHVELFGFQARLGTVSAKIPDQIPATVARNRYNRLFLKTLTKSKAKITPLIPFQRLLTA